MTASGRDTVTTEPRHPIHLVVLAGASAGIYAATLAGVAALQAGSDEALIEARAPLAAATTSVSAGLDTIQGALDATAGAYGDAAARYDRLARRLDALETSLDALAGSVSTVTGAAKALPQRVELPRVTRTVSTRVAPATHVTTGASGK